MAKVKGGNCARALWTAISRDQMDIVRFLPSLADGSHWFPRVKVGEYMLTFADPGPELTSLLINGASRTVA